MWIYTIFNSSEGRAYAAIKNEITGITLHVPYRQLVGKSDKVIESFVKEIADKLNS
tara:strand:+ start:3754 stop:3921 length:168 start_codon:yes stop_codon:yes gene_type:complete